MKYRCRCSNRKCYKRKTLNKHPNDYVRPPKCPWCLSTAWVVDKYRQAKGFKDRSPRCECHALLIRHRYGQDGCMHRDEFLIESSIKNWEHKKLFRNESCNF